MEELITNIEQGITKRLNPDQYKFEVKNLAQIEIIEAYGGDDRAGTWIDAYAPRFNELMNDAELGLLHRLGDKEAHDGAIEEIKQKLYH